jgi:hypothetical protein
VPNLIKIGHTVQSLPARSPHHVFFYCYLETPHKTTARVSAVLEAAYRSFLHDLLTPSSTLNVETTGSSETAHLFSKLHTANTVLFVWIANRNSVLTFRDIHPNTGDCDKMYRRWSEAGWGGVVGNLHSS